MTFNENTFVWALTARPEDTKTFAQIFRPEWLETVAMRPVLAEIYSFTREHGEPPSLVTLHQIFKDKDSISYENRYKKILSDIQINEPDRSEQIYELGKARDVAKVRSFAAMCQDEAFMEKQAVFDGEHLVRDVENWIRQFEDVRTDRTMDIKSAVEHLVQSAGFNSSPARIPCGIKPLDEWTGGGLRPKQLGLIIAPTGHGKSAILLIMAHWIAQIEGKRVWMITNELPLEEVTERTLARMTGIPLDKIMDDPAVAYTGLERHWKSGLANRLIITDINREATTEDFEAEMARMANLHGWKPDVVIVDFMERMKPTLSGHRRDKEWQWIGGIAKDLVRFSKKHNIMCWSAGQTNREGLKVDSGGVGLHMVQGSIRHLQEATAVITARQIPIPGLDEEDAVAIEFQSQKMRQSRLVHRPKIVKANLSKMFITSEEIEITQDENDDGPIFDSTNFGQNSESPRERQIAKQRKRAAAKRNRE